MRSRALLGALRAGSFDRVYDFRIVEDEFRVLEEVLSSLFVRDPLGRDRACLAFLARSASQTDRNRKQNPYASTHVPRDLSVGGLFSGCSR